MRVAARIRCGSCNSVTYTHDNCTWCGKPVPGSEPRAPTAEEMTRWTVDNLVRAGGVKRRNGASRKVRVVSNATIRLFNDCEAFIREFKLSDGKFCKIVGRSSRFVTELRDGHPLKDGTADKIRATMAKYRASR